MAWMKTAEALLKLPQLLFQDRISFTFDGVPLTADRLSLRRKLNLLKVGVDMKLKSGLAHGLPPTIQVEPTNVCNMKCPLCPTGTGSMKRRKGFMSFDTFQRILDDLGDVLLSVFLYGWGEPFLNKEMPRMIEACTTRNIDTLTDTNGQCIQTPDEALKIVDAGLTAMIIAIDGSTQEIYQAYRKSGDVEKVKRCATLIEEAKAKRGTKFPYTIFRAIVTRDNQDDVSAIEQLARDLKINMFSHKTLGMLTYSEDFRDYEPEGENIRRFEYQNFGRRRKSLFQCFYPRRQPTIFWDGIVVSCEYDYNLNAPWGNIRENSFSEIWNSPQAVEMRRIISIGLPRPRSCQLCPYQDRVQDSTYLSCKELWSVNIVNKV